MTPYALPPTAPMTLWWSDLDAPEAATRDATWLSDAERTRAARFVHDMHRRRYVAAHTAVRQLLSNCTGHAPAALRFREGPYGKPALDGTGDCAFNLSHSDHLAVVAVAPGGDIGVDVELLRPMADAEALARHNFTASEQAEWHALPAAERDAAFLYGWTRKEACLKAIGCGLQVEPHSFGVGLRHDPCDIYVLSPDGPVGVKVQSLRDGDRAIVSWAEVRSFATDETRVLSNGR